MQYLWNVFGAYTICQMQFIHILNVLYKIVLCYQSIRSNIKAKNQNKHKYKNKTNKNEKQANKKEKIAKKTQTIKEKNKTKTKQTKTKSKLKAHNLLAYVLLIQFP